MQKPIERLAYRELPEPFRFTPEEDAQHAKVVEALSVLTKASNKHYLFFAAKESETSIAVFLHGEISQKMMSELGLRLISGQVAIGSEECPDELN